MDDKSVDKTNINALRIRNSIQSTGTMTHSKLQIKGLSLPNITSGFGTSSCPLIAVLAKRGRKITPSDKVGERKAG